MNVLNAHEAAKYLGISESWLYQLCFMHEIPYLKPRGRLCFRPAELDAWLEGGRVKTNAEVQAEADELLRKRKRRTA